MAELDRLYRALASEQRRLALSCLQHHQTMTLPDLAELVAERQYDADISAIPSERVSETYFKLYHTHIPILEECDLVQYRQSDDIVLASDRIPDAMDRVRENVERLQTASTDSPAE